MREVRGTHANEFAICKGDIVYFIENHCHIIDQETQDVHKFVGYDHQREFWELFQDAHFTREPDKIWHLMLKARQVGFTWAAVAAALWKVTFFNNEHVVFMSENGDKAKEVLERANFMFSMMPDWLQMPTIANNSEMLWFGKKRRDNKIDMKESTNSKIQSVPTTPTGVQSKTLTAFIGDEWASVEHAKNILFRSVRPALERSRGICILISTAKPNAFAMGAGKLFGDLWHTAKLKGTELWNRFNPHFCPWMGVPGRTREWYESQFDGSAPEEMVKQEYPETEADAFTSANRNVFNVEMLSDRKREIMQKRIPVKRGIINEDEFQEHEKGNIWIWKEAEQGHLYSIGVDSSSGVSVDYTCIKVYDCTAKEEVAEVHGKIKPVPTAHIADRLGKMYNEALIIVEIELHGTKVQDELYERLNYPNLYTRRTFNKLENRYEENLGWKTTRVSRPKMIDDLVYATERGHYTLYSVRTIDEMVEFEEDENGRADHPVGGHSDRIFGSALAYQGSLYGMSEEVGAPTSIEQDEVHFASFREQLEMANDNTDWRYV